VSQSYRLAAGGQINRQRKLAFTFDGREYSGYAGDTLASALLANGVHFVGRSFRFHRPRGILSAGVEEPNALVTVGSGASGTPNVRVTLQPLRDGLLVRSQNRWPSLRFDVGGLVDVVHRCFPAGFYNKTFMWPRWHTWEPLVRRAAGLGEAPSGVDPDRYAWRNAFCDVLVIGAGIAGLNAAMNAAGCGRRVLLVDQDRAPGGQLNWAGADDLGAARMAEAQLARLKSQDNVRLLTCTTVVGAYDHGIYAAVEDLEARGEGPLRQRWWRIRASEAVLATGATEQPLVFAFNDLPGIMLADSVRQYVNRYAVAIGRRVAVVTNNDSAYRAAIDLHARGVDVPCVVDTRKTVRGDLLHALTTAGIASKAGACVTRAHGRHRVRALEIEWRGSHERIDCDGIAMSGGWSPAVQLYAQAGGSLRFDEQRKCLVPSANLPALQVVGAAAGEFALPGTQLPAPVGAIGFAAPALRSRAWLDFQHDVTVADVDLAVLENLRSVEHVKRYTTAGMSIDQGKTSNLNTLAVLAAQTNRTVAQLGTTTYRPMFMPVTLAAIAGDRVGKFYRPQRRLPSHSAQVVAGAVLENYGGWLRPAVYLHAGEAEGDAIRREARAVRQQAGLFEASSLGKFLVRGPDAEEFLERIYGNSIRTLQPGKVRYGIMLDERGIVIDDGVCARLAPDEFYVNSTSSGATRLAAWFENWLQCEWSDLRVIVTDVTGALATLTVAGPKARDVLAQLGFSIDLAAERFPHMHVRSGTWRGLPCRILRVSYTGELSYEISVPADYGKALWDQLMSAGAAASITPFGVETLMTLRLEKGYLHVGSDTDGTTMPDDIGFGTQVERKACDFIGRRSLSLPESRRVDRLQFVGLCALDASTTFVAGAHLAALGGRVSPPVETEGYVTSACASPTLGRPVGLAMLKQGRARLGEVVRIFHAGKCGRAQVVAPVHFDPKNERVHA
jgi:sarcosine oxidase subunit alpha